MGSFNETTIKAGTVVNTDISNGAGIEASKLQHQQIFVSTLVTWTQQEALLQAT